MDDCNLMNKETELHRLLPPVPFSTTSSQILQMEEGHLVTETTGETTDDDDSYYCAAMNNLNNC